MHSTPCSLQTTDKSTRPNSKLHNVSYSNFNTRLHESPLLEGKQFKILPRKHDNYNARGPIKLLVLSHADGYPKITGDYI